MKRVISLEEIAITAVAIYFLYYQTLGMATWLLVVLFFTPDISMLGYLAGNKAGAISYNIFHHRGLAVAVASFGYFLDLQGMITIGLLLFAHASFDRIFGYGLKYSSGFKHTHLGDL